MGSLQLKVRKNKLFLYKIKLKIEKIYVKNKVKFPTKQIIVH